MRSTSIGNIVSDFRRRMGFIGGGGVALICTLFLVISPGSTFALLAGFGLSFMYVASNFMLVSNIDLDDQKRFFTFFFVSFTVRFILVLVCFALILAYIKIDQILFTISFIISYIFNSVIEIIFINKILENRHED